MNHCQCQCERMLNKEGIAFAAGPHFVKEKTFIMIIFDDFLYTLMNVFDIDRLVIIIILAFISIEIYVEPLMVVIWAPMIKCLRFTISYHNHTLLVHISHFNIYNKCSTAFLCGIFKCEAY